MSKKPTPKRFMYACLSCSHREIVDTVLEMFNARQDHHRAVRHKDPYFAYLETNEAGQFVQWVREVREVPK